MALPQRPTPLADHIPGEGVWLQAVADAVDTNTTAIATNTSSIAAGLPAAGVAFTATQTGYASPPTASAKYLLSGRVVALRLPAQTGTSNSTALTITGLPAAARPTVAQTVLCLTTDNGTATISVATIGTNGTITFGLTVANLTTGYTASGTKAIPAQTLVYCLDDAP